MNRYIMVMPSVTYALKGRDTLRRNGISARVERINPQNGGGCGYGVVVSGNPAKAEAVLSNAGLRITEIKDY